MNCKVADICIIGGGASGMIAAIAASQKNRELSVLLLEKKDRLGSKLLATGNGRCNIGNMSCSEIEMTRKFLESIGIYCREEEEGRLYPMTEQAKDVVFALEERLNALGVKVITSAETREILKIDDSKKRASHIVSYLKEGKTQRIQCKNVLIAMGGKAAPQFGTTGDGYKIAKDLGHTINKLAPSLTPLISEDVPKEYRGIRAKVNVKLLLKGKVIAAESGILQFTEKGLSGICIFNLSRLVDISENIKFSDYIIEVDFLPEISLLKAEEILASKRKIKDLAMSDLLNTIVDRRIAKDILNDVSKGDICEGTLDIKEIAKELKARKFVLCGAGGWKEAQCTRGGVELAEVNLDTMESKLALGIFFSGEIINYDGPCGGFNLQNAWESGIKAGRAMAEKCFIE